MTKQFWMISILSTPSDLLTERFGATAKRDVKVGFGSQAEAEAFVVVLQAKTVAGWTKTYTVKAEGL